MSFILEFHFHYQWHLIDHMHGSMFDLSLTWEHHLSKLLELLPILTPLLLFQVFLVNFHRDKQMNERCDLNMSANKKNEMRECSGGGPVNQKENRVG